MVAREALRHHRRNNLCHILCNQWFRVKNIIDRHGGSYIDYRPSYINEAVWKSLCDYWASPTFQRRSGVARIARQHVTPHIADGISFRRRSWDIHDKCEVLATYNRFVRGHTKKDTKESTSEVVPDILVCKSISNHVLFAEDVQSSGKMIVFDDQSSSSDNDDDQPRSFSSSNVV